MAEITDEVTGQESLDGIQQEQQDGEVQSIPGQEVAPLEPEFISETLYIQNLNDRVKLPCEPCPEASTSSCSLSGIDMKATLDNLFRHYGKVTDVVAHHNLRMRGQAFVSFLDAEIAKKAMQEVKGFPLYGKSMVALSLISYIHC
jgi:U2 small nuclear ribonucleoprotein B''